MKNLAQELLWIVKNNPMVVMVACFVIVLLPGIVKLADMMPKG